MVRGRQRQERQTIYSQAALVWGFQKIDARTWIDEGVVHEMGGEAILDEQQAANVAKYEERIREAGHFVMPE